MCGLYGVYSRSFTADHVKLFSHLAMESQTRGLHACGVAAVQRRKKGKKTSYWYEWSKEASNAGVFFLRESTQKLLNDPNNVVLLGHNRFATVGKKDNVDGAHPFEHENVVGAHNGTLHDNQYSPDKDFFSDSDRLFFNIANDGLKKTIQDIKNGAYALTWLDKATDRLNFYRNLRRDLWFMWSEDESSMAWASEKEFLELAAYETKKKWSVPYEFKTSTLFSISVHTGKHTTETINPYTSVPKVVYNSGKDWRNNDRQKVKYKNGSSVRLKDREAKLEAGSKDRIKIPDFEACPINEQNGHSLLLRRSGFTPILFFEDPVKHEEYVEYFNNVAIPLKSYQNLVNKGCVWCSDVKGIDTHLIWLDQGSHVCSNCIGDPCLHELYNLGNLAGK